MKTKNLVVFLLTSVVEAAIAYFAALKFSVRFIELMFFAGLLFATVTFFFSSSGGRISEFHSSQISGQTGLILKKEPFVFKKGPVFTASALFLLVGLVLFILLFSGVIPPASS
ncbi:hypothetical protein D1B31_15400 [Neobacillus notoginsengisoli]|uniref:DUF3899 domain-containing protein n=1 Tax=Neobacillus notoginsengisoli TaxID=1578198 RepID=A0A417YS87_9BACI|nr:hypothetical protein [Neobacillus notoginsengisoli]RHW38156.1 hypothetical protein D1B31_15400 [Neobacillus notoginsengisoli]